MFDDRYDFDHDYAEDLKERWNSNIKKIRLSMIIVAAVMIVAGVLCFVFPTDTFAFMVVIAAIVLVARGVMQIIEFYRSPMFLRDPLALLGGIFAILVAAMIAVAPLKATATTLGFVLAFTLLSNGLEKFGLNWRLKFYLGARDSWVTFSAIVDIVVAVFFFLAPVTGLTAVGYLVAAYLVLSGLGQLIEAISLKPAE